MSQFDKYPEGYFMYKEYDRPAHREDFTRLKLHGKKAFGGGGWRWFDA